MRGLILFGIFTFVCLTMLAKCAGLQERVMEYITQLQQQHEFFSNMLLSLQKIKKKTPGNGFAIMKCKEKLAELNKIFDDIDYGVQITHD